MPGEVRFLPRRGWGGGAGRRALTPAHLTTSAPVASTPPSAGCRPAPTENNANHRSCIFKERHPLRADGTPQAPRRHRLRPLASAAALVLCGIVVGAALPRGSASADGPSDDPLAAVRAEYDLLLQNFVGKVDATALIAGALKGMASAVGDTWTSYFPPNQDQSFVDTLDGYGGIGVQIQPLGKGDVIETVIAGGPAQQAGLRAGELIVSVDGHPTGGQTSDQVAAEVRGDPGTQVTLGVLEPGQTTSVTITLTRAQISQPTVISSTPAEGVGLIKITQFSSTTGDEFDRAYQALQQRPGGLKGLILDLRGNPGGYVSAAVHIAGEIAPAGPLLDIVDGQGHSTAYTAADHPAAPPTVILVDGGTASAAEILAGSLQYRHAATLVGQQTYGKGSVQQLFQLPGGGAVKVTVSHDQLPDGKSWDHVGLQPDVAASPPPAPDAGLPEFAKVGDRDLHQGMIGLDVYGLQQRLQLLGYFAQDPDGIYGPTTMAAVQLFQRDAQVPVTGTMADPDWQTLGKAVGAKIQALKAVPQADLVMQKGLDVLRGLVAGA